MDKEFASCCDQAMRYLSIREHNVKELVTKLKQKDYSSETIDKVINFLEDEGSLSEDRYIRVFITSSNKRHPEGKSMILMRLAQKGADRNLSRKIADEIYTKEYEDNLVDDAYCKLVKKGKTDNIRINLLKLGFSVTAVNEYLFNLQ